MPYLSIQGNSCLKLVLGCSDGSRSLGKVMSRAGMDMDLRTSALGSSFNTEKACLARLVEEIPRAKSATLFALRFERDTECLSLASPAR